MRSSIVRSTALIAAFALLSIVPLSVRAEDTPTIVERPTWVPGNWWEFEEESDAIRKFRLTVVGTEGDQYVVVSTPWKVAPEPDQKLTRLWVWIDGSNRKRIRPDGTVTEWDRSEHVRFPL